MSPRATGDAPARPADALALVSHALCPYVQRCVICASEKGIAFRRVDVDLADRPAWFRALSPLGKVPLLQVPGVDAPLFESDVICQYLDETAPGRLLPRDPLARARHRAWAAFASSLLDEIARLYNAPDRAALDAAVGRLRERLARVEDAVGEGPWFGGARFGLVDAAFAPAFRYFEVLEPVRPMRLLDGAPRTAAWSRRLRERPSVMSAVAPDYPQRLLDFVAARDSALGAAVRAVRVA